jgi:hypothetical protein
MNKLTIIFIEVSLLFEYYVAVFISLQLLNLHFCFTSSEIKVSIKQNTKNNGFHTPLNPHRTTESVDKNVAKNSSNFQEF